MYMKLLTKDYLFKVNESIILFIHTYCMQRGYNFAFRYLSLSLSIYIYIYIYIIKLKLVTIVKCYPKAPFSIATILRCRGGHNFPWSALLYP